MLNLGLKAEKPLQNENHTEDWALGSHPRDNGHVTHLSLKSLYIYIYIYIYNDIIFNLTIWTLKRVLKLLVVSNTTPFFAVVQIIYFHDVVLFMWRH